MTETPRSTFESGGASAGLTLGRSRLAFFGELIIRMSPPDKHLLSHADCFSVFPGGAEANVAIALAGLGHSSRMISCVPDNPLGRLAVRHLRGAGVDCRHVTTGPGRMALYFMSSGAGLRASEVVYDRANSTFSGLSREEIDWDAALADVELLHMSGVTAALGSSSANLAISAALAARERSISISFDANYRAQLWGSWKSDPRSILCKLVSSAEIFFGNHRDIGVLLNRDFTSGGENESERRAAVRAAFQAFPNLRVIASTTRRVDYVDAHRLGARIDTPDECVVTEEIDLPSIVERVGGGDAFAAGVLHGLLTSGSIEQSARLGLALSALKHSVPGDATDFSALELERMLEGSLDIRR